VVRGSGPAVAAAEVAEAVVAVEAEAVVVAEAEVAEVAVVAEDRPGRSGT
jgi:hypothetical protein